MQCCVEIYGSATVLQAVPVANPFSSLHNPVEGEQRRAIELAQCSIRMLSTPGFLALQEFALSANAGDTKSGKIIVSCPMTDRERIKAICLITLSPQTNSTRPDKHNSCIIQTRENQALDCHFLSFWGELRCPKSSNALSEMTKRVAPNYHAAADNREADSNLAKALFVPSFRGFATTYP